MIKRIRITNFKSLLDVSVELDPVSVLIGRTGTGKTNFVEALRFLRDCLTTRNVQGTIQNFGGWPRVLPATASAPLSVTFDLAFNAPGLTDEYQYLLSFRAPNQSSHPAFFGEKLQLGARVLFHQSEGRWVQAPPLAYPPATGEIILGALTGVQEVTIAHLVLTTGIGCYAFPDHVLTGSNHTRLPQEKGYGDSGENFLQIFDGIHTNLQSWHQLRDIAAALRNLKPSLKTLDLDLPGRQQIKVTYPRGDKFLVFDVDQESEGFRRLLACLLALYQTPSKQTLIFDEPEKGIYPAGLAVLADEFKACAAKGRGQVLLTTHSPDFLDHFSPEQIRVVEMRDYATRIGPIVADQVEALREHFLQTKELLTVDEARLEEQEPAVAQ